MFSVRRGPPLRKEASCQGCRAGWAMHCTALVQQEVLLVAQLRQGPRLCENMPADQQQPIPVFLVFFRRTVHKPCICCLYAVVQADERRPYMRVPQPQRT